MRDNLMPRLLAVVLLLLVAVVVLLVLSVVERYFFPSNHIAQALGWVGLYDVAEWLARKAFPA